jgi:crotonobetainyl-CoA:carnitine CoA-transferase CaiB-like acyl-CoA transferase
MTQPLDLTTLGDAEKVTLIGALLALEREGVPVGPINAVAVVFADPQVIARDLRIDLPAPQVKGGRIPSYPLPHRARRHPATTDPPAPT